MSSPRRASKTKKVSTPRHGSPVARFPRVTIHPGRMGGMPCIRDHRFTVAQLLALLAAEHSREEILETYPFLEPEDFSEALGYASWLAEFHDELIPTA